MTKEEISAIISMVKEKDKAQAMARKRGILDCSFSSVSYFTHPTKVMKIRGSYGAKEKS